MNDRDGIFAGNDPFDIARRWLASAEVLEPNDPNAMALATVDETGLPDVRIVLLKEISGQANDGAFHFFTNYESVKGQEIESTGVAAFVMHWKSLRRQIRVRGQVTRLDAGLSDKYYASRALESRIGAWASAQSRRLVSRDALIAEVERQRDNHGLSPKRPDFWGGYAIHPIEIEFWSDGEYRLHDRFRWVNLDLSSQKRELFESWEHVPGSLWAVARLSP